MVKYDNILFVVFEVVYCEELLVGFDFMFNEVVKFLLIEVLCVKQEVDVGCLQNNVNNKLRVCLCVLIVYIFMLR